MKYTLRVSTAQYEYIEQEVTCDTPEEAVEHYRALQEASKGHEGLPDKDFNRFIDRMLLGDANHVEEYQLMSPGQQAVVQAVKRSLKRIEARQNK